MTRLLFVASGALLGGLLLGPSWATAREWKDDSGKKVDAEYQKFDLKTGIVTLKPKKGKSITIPVESLSREDQTFVYGLQGPPIGKPLPPGPPAPKLTAEKAIERFKELGGNIQYPNNDMTQKAIVSIYPKCKDPDAALEAARMLPDFERLTVAYSKVTPAGMAHLGQMKNVESVTMQGIKVLNDSTVRYIAAIPGLKSTAIYASSVTSKALESLSESKSLEALTLTLCPLKPADVAPLKKLSSLAVLELNSCEVDDDTLEVICQLSELQQLAIHCGAVSDKGIPLLKKLPKLNMLTLRETRITDAGMKDIAALPELVRLRIDDNALTDQGLALLNGKKNLISVTANGTKVTPAAAKALLDSLTDRSKEVKAEPAKPDEKKSECPYSPQASK